MEKLGIRAVCPRVSPGFPELLVHVDCGKVDVELVANEEKEDGAEGGKDEAGRMKPAVRGTCNHVGDAASEDRAEDAENDRPEEGHVDMHDGFREEAGDKANQEVPDQVEHAVSPP